MNPAYPPQPTASNPHPVEALYRFPLLSKRWKSLGVFATYAVARAALDEFLKGRTYRAIDLWFPEGAQSGR